MLGLPKAKPLAYSQLSRCLWPANTDTGPNFTGTAEKNPGSRYSLQQTLDALQRVRLYLGLCLFTSHLFGNNIAGSKHYFLEEPTHWTWAACRTLASLELCSSDRTTWILRSGTLKKGLKNLAGQTVFMLHTQVLSSRWQFAKLQTELILSLTLHRDNQVKHCKFLS